MPHRFTREELYERVWSEPMKTIAAQFSISDVGLSKACRRYGIPVPERGYWAKLRAGKKVQRRPLSVRGPGMSSEVVVGAGNNWAYRNQVLSDQEILQAAPVPPIFEREIDDVAAEVRAGVGRVTVPKVMPRPHHLIAKLLETDEGRRRKAATERFVFSWDEPQFDSPFEKRRLRLLNAIFTALTRYGMRPEVRGREARELYVQVNDQNVAFSVDDANVKPVHHPAENQRARNPSGRMKVIIRAWRAPDHTRRHWEDTKTDKVEKFATDIVVGLIMAGEHQYREGAKHRYEWMVERKAELIEAVRKRREEAEQKERERIARLEQERVDSLLADAAALRQASNIRAYVGQVKHLCAAGKCVVSDEDLRKWASWALAQADRIDPVASARFLSRMGGSAD